VERLESLYISVWEGGGTQKADEVAFESEVVVLEGVGELEVDATGDIIAAEIDW
jgi:hypothetical protein